MSHSFGSLGGSSQHLVILTPTTQEWKDIQNTHRISGLRSLSSSSRGRPASLHETGLNSDSEDDSDPFSDDDDESGGALSWSVKKRHPFLPSQLSSPPTRSFSRSTSGTSAQTHHSAAATRSLVPLTRNSSSSSSPISSPYLSSAAATDPLGLTRTVTADPLEPFVAADGVSSPNPNSPIPTATSPGVPMPATIGETEDPFSISFREASDQPVFDRSISSSWKETGLFTSPPPSAGYLSNQTNGLHAFSSSSGTWPRRTATRSGFLDLKSDSASTDDDDDDETGGLMSEEDEDGFSLKVRKARDAKQQARTSGMPSLGWGVSQIGSFGFGSLGLGSFGGNFGDSNQDCDGNHKPKVEPTDDAGSDGDAEVDEQAPVRSEKLTPSRSQPAPISTLQRSPPRSKLSRLPSSLRDDDGHTSSSYSSPQSPELETPINLHPPTPSASHPSDSAASSSPYGLSSHSSVVAASSTSSLSSSSHPHPSYSSHLTHHQNHPSSSSISVGSMSPLSYATSPPLSPRLARRRQSQKSQRLSTIAGRQAPSPFNPISGHGSGGNLAGLSPFSPFSAFPAVDLTSVGGGGYFGTQAEDAHGGTRELKTRTSYSSLKLPPYLREGDRLDSTTSVSSLVVSLVVSLSHYLRVFSRV